ncbi:hypothetical protein ACM66B_005321 [Microbotryomycetes sp. NB124-2]
MQVFVTGATGTVGKAVIPRLLAKGHIVSGLARSEDSLNQLTARGVKPVKGGITDLDVCAAAAKEADAVIHLAFDHDKAFRGQMPEACELDRAVIKAMAEGLLESSSNIKLFIYSSGVLGTTKETDESPKVAHLPRYMSTDLVFSYADKGLRASQIRLAAVTFGPDKPHPFIGAPVPKYKELGFVAYPENSGWPALDVEDAADLYILLLENDKLPNPVTLHATVDPWVPMKDVAESLGQKLGLPAKPMSKEELPQHFGTIGAIMTMVTPASNKWTREVTGWNPQGKSLLEQIKDWDFES